MTVTYPPEMLPPPDPDQEAEVIVICTVCGGAGYIQETDLEGGDYEIYRCPACVNGQRPP